MGTQLTGVINGVNRFLSGGQGLGGDSLIYLAGLEGLGMAPSNRLRERGPFQHGSTDLGFRLQSRSFSVVWEIVASTDAGLEGGLDNLLEYLRPSDNLIGLKFTLPSGAVRRIDACVASNPLTLNTSDRRGYSRRVACAFDAPDPTLYDPTQEVVSFTVAGDGMSVPTPVPTPIGVGSLYYAYSLLYTGTWREYPIIRITGPITNPAITNETTGEVLDFTGYTVEPNTYIEVDTRYGRKTVTNPAGHNLIAELTTDSDLATWHIESSPDADNGYNTIVATGLSVNADTEITIRYYNRYIGLPV